jgi:type I restriction enzyme S subunit
VGTAAVSRNRFKEEEFLSFSIPLPPLPVQEAIVAHWRKAQEKVQEALANLERQLHELDVFLRCKADMAVFGRLWIALSWCDMQSWDMKAARAAYFKLRNPSFRPLGLFAEEATELVKPWESPDKDWPVYGVNNKEGVFFSHHQKGKDFNAPYKRIRKDCFFHNPTRSSVGSLGIVPEVPEDALTSPEYQVWRIRAELVPGYVAVLIGTPFFIDLVQVHRVGAVKQRLYVENLLQIPVPVVPEAMQVEVADERERLLSKLADARRRAATAQSEVEEMILGIRPVG